MNKIYKTIWNALRRCLVVVSEATNSAAQRGGPSLTTGSELNDSKELSTSPFKRSKLALNAFPFSSVFTALVLCFATQNFANAAPAWQGDLDRDYRQDIQDGLVIDDGEWGLAHEGNYILWFKGSVSIEHGSAFGSMIRDGVNTNLSQSNNIFYNHGGLYLSAWRDGGTYYFSNGAGVYNYSDGNFVLGYLNGTSWADGVEFNGGSFLQNDGSTWNQSAFVIGGGTVTNNGKFVNETDSFTMSSGSFTGSGTLENHAQVNINGGTFRVGTLTLVGGRFDSNYGTLVIGNQSGSLSAQTLNLNNGTLGVSSLNQNAGTINVNGTYTLNSLRQTGGTVNNNATLTLNNANMSGVLNNNRTLYIGGNTTIGQTINGGGSVSVSGTANIGGISGASSFSVTSGNTTVQSMNTGTINNAGNLTIHDFVKNSGVNYTQTGGSLTANNDWLTNSTLTIRGGSLTRNDLGANTINVAGGTVNTGTVSSDTIFNVSNGTLSANAFGFSDNKSKTVSVTGGALKTAISNIFTGLEGSTEDGLNTVSLSASVPEEIKTTLTEFFQKYAPGTVIDGLSDHISVSGGKVIVTGVNISNTMRDDLTKAFKLTFGDSAQIEFQGTISGYSQNDILNTAKVNELYQNTDLKDVIFIDRALEGEGGAVEVGNNGVLNSTGFMAINDATSVSVKDGKTLALIGAKANGTRAVEDLTGGVAVTADGNGSKLVLGTLGLADGGEYTGSLTGVTIKNGSGMEVVNGTYTVASLEGRDSGSQITVGAKGQLNGSNLLLVSRSAFENRGTTVLSGTMEGTGQSSVTNKGTLTVHGNSSLIGSFVNEGQATLADFDINGTFTNLEGATVDMNKLSVLGNLNNYGNLNAQDTSQLNGTLLNTGTIKLYDTTVAEGRGVLNNTHTIDAKGTITMNGLLSSVDNADLEALIVTGEGAIAGNSGTMTATDRDALTDAKGLIEISNGGSFYNSGTLTADAIVVGEGGYQINGGTMPTTLSTLSAMSFMSPRAPTLAVEQTPNLSVSEGGQKTNNGIGYYAQGTIAGTFTNAVGAQAYGGVSDVYVDGQGITIEKTGVIQNGGTFTMGGAMNNAGTIQGDGALVLQHAAISQNIFTNSGTIDVGTLTADDITFHHTGGSVQADAGWFTNSTVNVQGGTMAYSELGAGNTYNVGADTGTATLTIDRVTSDSVVNITEGGLFVAPEIALTEPEKTIHLLGGTLSTTLDQIFGEVYHTALDIDADTPDDLVDFEGVDVATGVGEIKDTVAAGVQFGWGTVAFDDGVYSTSMVTDVLQKLDANDPAVPGHEGTGVEGGLEVAFNGQASEVFSVDIANDVKARPAGTEEPFGSAYAVFTGETLTNTTQEHPEYNALYVGSADQAAANGVVNANILDNNIGFKNVVGVTGGMTVADGHHFVLVGENASSPNSVALVDGNLSIVRDGVVTLGTYGTEAATKGDLLDVALDDGTFRVRHGDFTADAVTSAGTIYIGGDGQEHGGSVLREDADSSLSVASYQANAGSELLNWGTFTVASMTSADNDAGSLINYNTLDVETADTATDITNLKTAGFDSLTLKSGGDYENGSDSVKDAVSTIGTFVMNAGSTFKNFAQSVIDAGTISGEYTNAEGASDDFESLTIATTGQYTNNGTSTVGSLTQTGGLVDNAGTFTIEGTGASIIAGEMSNSGKLTVNGTEGLTLNDGADVTNTGTWTATAPVTVAGGKLTQASETAMSFDSLSVTGGQVAVNVGTAMNTNALTVDMSEADGVGITNAGTITGTTITVTQGAIEGEGTLGTADSTITVEANGRIDQDTVNAKYLSNSGTVVAGAVTLVDPSGNNGTMTVENVLNGRLTNNGSLTLGGGAEGFELASGLITNNGTLVGAETVRLTGGNITHQSTTTATFKDLMIESGRLSVLEGSAVEGENLTIASDDVSSQIQNEGKVDFDAITVTKGSIAGEGTLGAVNSIIDVKADGAIDQASVEGDQLTNAGTIDADNLTVHTSGSNTGTITSVVAALGDAFENAASGVMNLADSLTGEITNNGTINIAGENGLTFTDGTLTNHGVLTATEKVTIGSDGFLIQDADQTATFTELEVVAGGLTVNAGKTAQGDSLTVNMASGADAVGVTNNGTVNFNSINVTQGTIEGTGTLGSAGSTIDVAANGTIDQATLLGDTLTNAGTVIAGVLDVETSATNTGSMTLKDRLEGNLTNDGSLTLDGGQADFVYAQGTLTNNGTFVAKETVSLEGGRFVQASDTKAIFADLDITAGGMTVNAGKVVEGEMLTVDMADSGDVAIDNDGIVDFDNIQLAQGTISGEGTLGASNTIFMVQENGIIDQAKIEGWTFANDGGSVTADQFIVHASGLNQGHGVITASDADFGDNFTQAVGSTINLSDSMTGNLASAGTINIAGDSGFTLTDGKLTNNGVLTATEKVTIGDGGKLAHVSATEATFTDLDVLGGDVMVNRDTSLVGDNLRIELASGDLVGLTNYGTVDFDTIRVALGTVKGTGTLGSEDSTILVGVGGHVIQGAVIANEFTNLGEVRADVTVNNGTNVGTVNAGDLTITGVNGTLTNTGTISTTGQANVAGLVNENSMTFGNGATMTGTNVNHGSIVVNGDAFNVASGMTTVEGHGNLTANAGLTVGSEGALTIDGENAQATVTGGATINGTLTSSGVTSIDKVNGASSGTLVAAGGSLTVGDLTETDHMTFTQTADTEYDFGKGWFENSTINIEGGHFDASVIHDDEGNASGMLGHNTVNIGKADIPSVVGPDSTLPSEDKVDWAAGFVAVDVDTVTSDTVINILNGGVLDVDHINLTPEDGAGVTITVGAGGGIQTSLDQFFEKVATTVTKVDAVDPETGKVDIVTDVVATTTVTDVKDSIKNGLVFEDGSMVAWDDDDWSVDLVASTSNSLADAGLISEDIRVQQHFLGDFMGDFTVDTATRLEEEQAKLDQSYVLDPGVVFDTTTLHNVTAAAQDANRGLVIGGEAGDGENQINYSTGFKNVANADYVTIEGGKEFVLVGEFRDDDFDWTTDYDDSNKLLIDAEDGGLVTVNDGTFTMGSAGLVESTVGWIENAVIADAGNLVTKNGEFAAWNITNAGKIDVTAGSILHTNIVDNTDGVTHVAGGFTADEFINSDGMIDVAAGGLAQIDSLKQGTMTSEITNAGSLTISEVQDGILAGHLTNTGADSALQIGSDFTLDGWIENEGTAIYENVTVELGSLTNSGSEQGKDLVLSDSTSHTNSGLSIWNNVTVGSGATATNTATGENQGYKVGSDADGESFVIDGTFENGTMAKLDATEAELTTVGGVITNAGVAGYNDMTIEAEGSSYNEGYEAGNKLTIADGGLHTNVGTSVWNEVLVQNGGTAVMGDEAKGQFYDILGKYTNEGTVDASEAETVNVKGGLFETALSGTSTFDDLTIAANADGTKGTVIVSGLEKGDALHITSGGQHWVKGESIWNSITVDEGGLDQFGTEADGESYEIGGTYVNNGTINAENAEMIVVTGHLTNNGQAGYQDMTISADATSVNTGYEHGEDLVVAAGGEHTNTGTSIWNTADVQGSMTNGSEITDGVYGNDQNFESDAILGIGTDAEGEVFNVAGTFTNHGLLDASKVENTTVSGSITNDGQANYVDMTIAEGGVSTNIGYEHGEDLVIAAGGGHTNTGTSIWNTADVQGSMTNGSEITDGIFGNDTENFKSDAILGIGTDAEGEVFNVAGTFTNHGLLDASKVENTTVSGSITNDGQANYVDMTIAEGGVSTNIGYEHGEDLVIAAGGEHTNTGTSIWNTADVQGSMTNGSEITDGIYGNDTENFESDAILGVGTDETDDVYNIAGTMDNHGIVDATKAETTNVSGELTNDGQALYDDMTVTGSSENIGYEKGDILTVANGGEHTNTGTSIWNNVTVGEGSNGVTGSDLGDGPKGHEEGFESDSIIGIGSDAEDDVFDVAGDYTNHGKLDATKTEDTNVSGNLYNDGQANYDDMTIADGGSSVNDGYEKGDILTVEAGGEHTNTGVSIWNNQVIGGSATNDGSTVMEDGFEITDGGNYTNNGDLDATGTETTIVGGDLDNNGHAEYDDMDITENGSSVNDNYEKGDILDVGGDWTNNGESHWNNVIISEGGETHFGDDSQTDIGKVTVDGGDFIVDGDNITADEVELNKGNFVVGNHKPLGTENKVDFTIEVVGTMNTNTWVIGNGNLALGSTTDFDSAIGMPELPDHPARVTVGSTVTIGETGSLAVGTGVWTDHDNHESIANGDLYFAADSTTIINASSLGQTAPAFQATLDSAKVTVEDGATLVLGNIQIPGDYLITEGFDTSVNTGESGWTGGWTEDQLYGLPQDGSGLGWVLDLYNDNDSIWVNAKLEDVQNVYPDVVLPDNINDDMNHPEYGNVDDEWIESVLRDPNHSVGEKTQVINSVAEIGLASGSMALALNDLNTATGAVENRVSMMGEAFTADGTLLRDGRMGHALWLDVLYADQQADSYKASGNMETGFDASSYGFIMGYDHLLENHNVILGGAFSYQKGDADSAGNTLATANDYYTFGVHGYMAWSPSPALNVIGSVSYLRSSSEASQVLPFGNRSQASADMDADMFTAGVRAESTFKVSDRVKIVPHAGVRVVHIDQGSYDTKLDGVKAFSNDTDAATLVQFPIGVAVRMDHAFDNGWNIRPQADLTVIPQAGDTDQRIRVTGTHGMTDEVSGDFAGTFNTQMTLGVQADKGNATFGARYGLGVGGDGKLDNQVKVEFRYQF